MTPLDPKSAVAGALAALMVSVALGFAIVTWADSRYVPRREYELTIVEMKKQLDRIEASIERHVEKTPLDPPARSH